MEMSSSKLNSQQFDESFDVIGDDESDESNATPEPGRRTARLSHRTMDDCTIQSKRISDFIKKVKKLHEKDYIKDRYSSENVPVSIPKVSEKEKEAIVRVIRNLDWDDSLDFLFSLFRIPNKEKIPGLHKLFTLSVKPDPN